jgi:8-oxo-dGTP pyrophosphatase MutT (NUDIX family)
MFEGMQMVAWPALVPRLVEAGTPAAHGRWDRAVDEARQLIAANPARHNGCLRIAWAVSGEPRQVDTYSGEYAHLMAAQAGVHPVEGKIWALGSLGIIEQDGKWLLARRSQSVAYGGWLGMSASGFVDAGESWEQTLVREMGEEIGIRPGDIASITQVGCISHRLANLQGLDAVHVVRLAPDAQPRAGEEVAELVWADPHEQLELELPTLTLCRQMLLGHAVAGQWQIV